MSSPEEEDLERQRREFFSYIADGREHRARRVRRGTRWVLIGVGGLFVLAIAFGVGGLYAGQRAPELGSVAYTDALGCEHVWDLVLDHPQPVSADDLCLTRTSIENVCDLDLSGYPPSYPPGWGIAYGPARITYTDGPSYEGWAGFISCPDGRTQWIEQAEWSQVDDEGGYLPASLQ